jgi:hypothetical protein
MAIVIGVLATLIGGLLLALIFFLLSDFVFRLPALSGAWSFESETTNTSYNAYKGLKLTYLVLLWQEGNAIHGSGEKVREDLNGIARTYVGAQRSRIEVSGYLTKRYFTKSEVVLHLLEHAEKRQSSTMQTLTVVNDTSMNGSYVSTVANSSGLTRWVRAGEGLTFEGVG